MEGVGEDIMGLCGAEVMEGGEDGAEAQEIRWNMSCIYGADFKSDCGVCICLLEGLPVGVLIGKADAEGVGRCWV